MSAVAQLVLRRPADGMPNDQAVPDNTSPRVSITARFEGEVEMLSARPPPTHCPGIMFKACGSFHAHARVRFQMLW